MRRGILVVAALVLLTSSAHAQDRPKVGVLKLTASAPIFVGVEKGFFKAFGVDPELVYFQAAAPISTARTKAGNGPITGSPRSWCSAICTTPACEPSGR